MTGRDGGPRGELYDWYVRGLDLLSEGNADAAAHLLERAVAADPTSHSAREAWARALFDARRYPEARDAFATVVEGDPTNDYAQFGLGLAALRAGDAVLAVQHLSLATAMKPGQRHYLSALRTAKARIGTTADEAAEQPPGDESEVADSDATEGGERDA